MLIFFVSLDFLRFQHTATRRWLLDSLENIFVGKRLFQHTATRRWLLIFRAETWQMTLFQHTATRRWLRPFSTATSTGLGVSTHSHPKVAAIGVMMFILTDTRFNTQPPEGGCNTDVTCITSYSMFQHTATRRWLQTQV